MWRFMHARKKRPKNSSNPIKKRKNYLKIFASSSRFAQKSYLCLRRKQSTMRFHQTFMIGTKIRLNYAIRTYESIICLFRKSMS